MPAIITPAFSIPATVADLYIRVKRTFGDESGTQIEDADILRWANDGQLDIARKTHCLVKKETYNTGVGIYTLPPPVGFLFFVRAKCNGRLLSSISHQRLDSLYPERGVSYPNGTPEYITFIGSSVEIYPAPEAVGTANLEITYIARPGTLLTPSDALEIPDQYYEAVVRFCLMRAKELDQDWAAAQVFQKSYESEISVIRDDVAQPSQNTYPVVRDYEGDYE